MKRLEKAFHGRKVLKGLSAQIPAGQCVAIVGRSGCGKSTLLRLLAGLERATEGELLAGGAPLDELRGDIRLMFQESRLAPWKTVLSNVGIGLHHGWQEQALATLDTVGLADRANEWPAALSGGQKQRVALARALIHRPRLLLLDEPLGALDALTRIEMQRLIENLWRERGFTLILVTHDVHEAVMLADRVILLEEGRIGLDLPIELPRPRHAGQVGAALLESKILAQIFADGVPQADAISYVYPQ
ncbi:TPA: ATP-binding cassette domain-containing protein [Raoultella planticola]